MTSSSKDSRGPRRPDDSIGTEAGEWMARLTDDESEGQAQEFLRWVTQSPQHLALFLDTYEAYRRLGAIDPLHKVNIAAILHQVQEQRTRARKLTTFDTLRRGKLPRHRGQRWFAAAASLAALSLLMSHWVPAVLRSATATQLLYSTAVGEKAHYYLEDGSELLLNTASRAEVKFTRNSREVKLLSGEAFLKVRHEPTKPFILTIDGVRIIDVGTQFNVYRRPHGIRVSVIDGSVQLRCTCSVGTDLSKGEEADIVIDGKYATLDRRSLTVAELARSVAWISGTLSFNGEPLSDVIAEFNRYNIRQFVIADPEIANLPIAGFFPSPDPDRLLEILREQGVIAFSPDGQPSATIQLVAQLHHLP